MKNGVVFFSVTICPQGKEGGDTTRKFRVNIKNGRCPSTEDVQEIADDTAVQVNPARLAHEFLELGRIMADMNN